MPQALLAAMHYSRLVARRYGLLPWRALVQLRRQQAATGATFSNHSCLRRAWVVWMAGLQQARWAAACSQACALAARRLERQRALLAAGLAALLNNLQQARSAAGVAWHWHTRRLVSLVSACGRRATTIGRCRRCSSCWRPRAAGRAPHLLCKARPLNAAGLHLMAPGGCGGHGAPSPAAAARSRTPAAATAGRRGAGLAAGPGSAAA